MQNLTQYLTNYIEAGFALVPIPPNSKGPSTPGWNDKENCITTIGDIHKIKHGVGLAHSYSQPALCSIDIDDLSQAIALLASHDIDLQALLDDKLAVRIVSGKPNRAKLLYRLPPSLPSLVTRQIATNGTMILEFRCASKNGKTVQDVLPPSIHPETNMPYTWGGSGSFTQIPEIPQQLLELWINGVQGTVSAKTTASPRSAVMQAILSLPEDQGHIKQVQDALNKISADCPREQWMRIVFAIKSLHWICGKELAENWSRTSDTKWDLFEFEKLWNSAKEYGGISINTLFYLAQNKDVEHTAPILENILREASDNSYQLFNYDQGCVQLPLKPPPPRSYIFADTVVPGTLCVLAGLGGTAKTTLIMQVAIHGAIGSSIADLQVDSFASILFLGEETQDERNRRLGGLSSKLTDAQRADVEKHILCYPAAGKDIRLTQVVQNNLCDTVLAKEVMDLAEQHEANCGKKIGLIVFDHARLVMSGDPNAASDVTQLTRVLTDIAVKTNAAVVLLAHSPKSTHSKDDSSDAAEIFGSSAFADNARAAFVLSTMREKEAKAFGVNTDDRKHYVALKTVKANYAQSDTLWWFKKELIPLWQVIRLEPVKLYSTSLFPQHSALSKKIIAEISKRPVTERKLRDMAGVKVEPFLASEKEVMRTVERLLDEGSVTKRIPTALERDQYGLSHNIKEVLVAV
jgi:hypothetical protein